MSIRLAGMNSGMDTDAMVQELVKAYKTKGDKNVKNQKKAEWKQDAWKDLNKKIKSFYGKYAANMKYSSYYSKKSTTVSDPKPASVVSAVVPLESLAPVRYEVFARFFTSSVCVPLTALSEVTIVALLGSETVVDFLL